MQMPIDFDLGLWVAGLGPRLQAAQVREYEGDSWLLLFDNGLAVAIEHDADRALLVLTAALGKPPPGTEAAAHRLLLEVSALWRYTGGVRMGIDADEGDVIQLCDFALPGLNLDQLEACVRNFFELAGSAREQLRALSADVQVAPVRPLEFLRV